MKAASSAVGGIDVKFGEILEVLLNRRYWDGDAKPPTNKKRRRFPWGYLEKQTFLVMNECRK